MYVFDVNSSWSLRWIVGQVQEEADVVHGAIFLKIRLEEASCFHVDLRHQRYKFIKHLGFQHLLEDYHWNIAGSLKAVERYSPGGAGQ